MNVINAHLHAHKQVIWKDMNDATQVLTFILIKYEILPHINDTIWLPLNSPNSQLTES